MEFLHLILALKLTTALLYPGKTKVATSVPRRRTANNNVANESFKTQTGNYKAATIRSSRDLFRTKVATSTPKRQTHGIILVNYLKFS